MTSQTPSSDNSAAQLQTKSSKELRRRILSAVFLAALALVALVASPWSFLLLVIASATILFWEWGTATRGNGGDATTILQVACMTAVVIFMAVHKFELALIVFAATMVVMVVSGYQRKSCLLYTSDAADDLA